MKTISNFLRTTGEFFSRVSANSPTETVEEMVEDSEFFVVQGFYDLDNYYKDGEVKHRGQKPSNHHVFDIPSEQWVVPEGVLLSLVRQKRNQLLAATDYLYRSDMQAKMTEVQRTQLDAYCQALRDITSQDPANVLWPVKPSLP